MNKDEINRAIAEWAGWEPVCMCGDTIGSHHLGGNEHTFTEAEDCPDYFTDLNAVHEAEKHLTPTQKEGDHYAARLADVTGCDDMLFGFIHATAPQRCEALLRTLNKWQD